MGAKRWKWIAERWPTIRDNAVYDLVKWVVLPLLALGAYFIVTYWLPVFTALAPDEVKLISIVVAMLVMTTSALLWVVVISSRQRRERIVSAMEAATSKPVLLPRPPLVISGFSHAANIAAATPVEYVTLSPKDPNVHIDVQEILFRSQRSALLIQSGCYILMRLHLVNRGSIEATITEWTLKVVVGNQAFTAKIAAIPSALQIECPAKALQDRTFESIPRPALDESPHEPYKRGIPRTGWVMFFMETFGADYAPPYNAKFVLTVKDSMGEQHELTTEPSFYRLGRELVYR